MSGRGFGAHNVPKLTGLETIGDIRKAGYIGLDVTCPGCRASTCIGFRHLAERHRVRDDELVIAVGLRLVCRYCRTRASAFCDVRPWRIRDRQPREKGES